jgi:hypothetical protein
VAGGDVLRQNKKKTTVFFLIIKNSSYDVSGERVGDVDV